MNFEAGFRAPDRHKKGGAVSAPYAGRGKPKVGSCPAPLSCPAKNMRDITRTDNHYTNFQTLPKEVSTFAYGIKSCLPFIVMSVGYAEF